MGRHARAIFLILGIFIFVLFAMQKFVTVPNYRLIPWLLQLAPFVLMGLLLIGVLQRAQRLRQTPDLPAQLRSLEELRREGVLTDEEFATAKTRLLERQGGVRL
ncbi:MAG: SHOCT domain-containing protein [Candidatus Eremiobacteraeota bacterium]|nr:SHOCT domain-containing protein [Candidatus Eremiobacteraeota bacterium]